MLKLTWNLSNLSFKLVKLVWSWSNCFFYNIRVTSLELLRVVEFSGEQARPKVYGNGLQKVLGIWFDLALKVKYSTILFFKEIFTMNLYDFFFFIDEYKNGR